MYDTLKGVRAFHEAYGLPVKDEPDLTDLRTNALRIELLREELDELREALEAGDVVEALDALTDLQYVLDGAYLSLGFHLMKEVAFAEVQRSNMSKLGADGKPVVRESDGKILKGPNYSPPDLKSVYEAWAAQQENKAA
jgi:predicted HAD superfamily Cof-like phosphohydrolase